MKKLLKSFGFGIASSLIITGILRLAWWALNNNVWVFIFSLTMACSVPAFYKDKEITG
jgi:hypothetical protein